MSLLFNGSYANSTQPIWSPFGTGGGGGPTGPTGPTGTDYPIVDLSGNNIGGFIAGSATGGRETEPIGIQGKRIAFCEPGAIPVNSAFALPYPPGPGFMSFIDCSTSNPSGEGDYVRFGGAVSMNYLQTGGGGRLASRTNIQSGQSSVAVGPVPYLTSNSFIYLQKVKLNPTDNIVGDLTYNIGDISSNIFVVRLTDNTGAPLAPPVATRFNYFIVNGSNDISPIWSV